MLNQNIIKTALLGLSSKKMDLSAFPEKVQEVLEGKELNEELFLDALSLSFQYLQAGTGIEKIDKINLQIDVCPKEDLLYASEDIQLALKECTRSNHLQYSTHYIHLLAEKALKDNAILDVINFNKIVSKLIYSSKHLRLKNQYKSYNYRQTFLSNQEFSSFIISAFGNTGNWLYQMIDNKKNKENENLNAEGRRNLFEFYWFFEREKVIPFLEEYFQHERIGNQTFFMNTIRKSLKSTDVEILEFFDTYFNESKSKSKSAIQIKTVFETVKIFANINLEAVKEIEEIFLNIWKPRNLLNRGIKLKSKKEIIEIFLELDRFLPENFIEDNYAKDLDLKLHFLVQIINIQKATKLLKVKQEKYLSALNEIKSFNKYKEFNLLDSLTNDIFETKNKQAVKQIIKISKHRNNLDFLMLFSDEEIIDLLENEENVLSSNYYDVIDFVIYELNLKTRWSKKLTEKILHYILDNQSLYSGDYFYKTLWLCVPFFHKEVNKIAVSVGNSKRHETAWKRNEIQEFILNDLSSIFALNKKLNLLKN